MVVSISWNFFDMTTTIIRYSKIPYFLQEGEFYRSLSCEDQSSQIEVTEGCFCQTDSVENLQDFTKLLKATAFWGLDVIPHSLIKFCDESDSLAWVRVTEEEGSEIAFAHDLRAVFSYVEGEDVPLVTAMELGSTYIVTYLASQVTFELHPMKAAVKIGRMDYLQLLHSHHHPGDESVCELAAAGGHLECLEYLISHGCSYDGKLLEAALHNGHYDCIEFALKVGVAWPATITATLAKQGNLELLRYVVDHNCILNNDVTVAAAQRGHIACFQYLLNIGCPADAQACAMASASGHLACLELLHTSNVPWDAESTSNAARHGRLACLHYLHTNGCAWSTRTTEQAAMTGKFSCMRYLLENGSACTESIVSDSASGLKEPLLCIQYLVEEQGVYLNEDGFIFMHAFVAANFQAVQFLLDQGCPYQNCANGVLDVGAFLLKTRSTAGVERNFDQNLLKCVEIAHNYQWDMIKRNTRIIGAIVTNYLRFPLCYEYLVIEGIIGVEE